MTTSRLLIDISCATPAFQSGDGAHTPEPELAYILIKFVARMTEWGHLSHPSEHKLRASDGTTVGSAKLLIED